jgi:hypothetical protein
VRRRNVNGKWSRETCYAVTSLTVTQASHTPLAAIIRGRWGIEDRLHRVRDIDFDEDRSQVRTGSGPRILASLRNLAITILRMAGARNIAAALRYHSRRPGRPLRTTMDRWAAGARPVRKESGVAAQVSRVRVGVGG